MKKRLAGLLLIFIVVAGINSQEVYKAVEKYVSDDLFMGEFYYSLTLDISVNRGDFPEIKIPQSGKMKSIPANYMGIPTVKFIVEIFKYPNWYLDIEFISGTNSIKLLLYNIKWSQDKDSMALFGMKVVEKSDNIIQLIPETISNVDFINSHTNVSLSFSNFSIAISRKPINSQQSKIYSNNFESWMKRKINSDTGSMLIRNNTVRIYFDKFTKIETERGVYYSIAADTLEDAIDIRNEFCPPSSIIPPLTYIEIWTKKQDIVARDCLGDYTDIISQ